MPYIKQFAPGSDDDLREEVLQLVGRDLLFDDKEGNPGAQIPSLTEGELNFVVTTILSRWLTKEFNYSELNTVMGVIECVKLELYRRVAAPYEDLKRVQNGDVYIQTKA